MHPRTTARTTRAARLALASIGAAAALTLAPATGIVAGVSAQTTPPSSTPGSSTPGSSTPSSSVPGSDTTVPTTSVPTDTTTTDPTSTSTSAPETTVAPTDTTTPVTAPPTTVPVAATLEPVTSQAVGPPPAAGELAAAGPVSGGSPATARPSSGPTAAPAQAPSAIGIETPAVATPPVLGDVAVADRLDVGPAPVIASPGVAPAVGPRPEVLPNPLALRSAPSGVKLLLLILAVSGLGAAVTLSVSRRHQRTMDAVNLDLLLGLANHQDAMRRSDVVDRLR